MKKFYITLVFLCSSIYTFSQCFANIVSYYNVSCYGACDGMATVNVTGGVPPYSYLWNDPATQTSATAINLCPGTYTVTVFDGSGNVCTASVTITEPAELVVSCSSAPASCPSCSDGSVTAIPSGGNPGYIYTWSPGGCVSATCTGLIPGTYTVCVSDNNGCTTCNSVSVSFVTNVKEETGNDIISIYPNPASQLVNIDVELGAVSSSEIILTNILGEQLFTETIAETKTLKKTIPVNNLANGIYFITVKTMHGKSVHKFVKR